MGRTNIVIDEALLKRVMKLYGLKTKREAVDYALRKVAGWPDARRAALGLEGIGWDGDLDEMRKSRIDEL